MAPTSPGDVDREDRTRTSESSNAGVEGIQAMLSRVDMKGSPYIYDLSGKGRHG